LTNTQAKTHIPSPKVHTQVRTSILRPSVPNKPGLQKREGGEEREEKREEKAEAKPTTVSFSL
jgi:hypothetical protein